MPSSIAQLARHQCAMLAITIKRAADIGLVVAVQTFMLLQCGLFYALMHLRARNLRRLMGLARAPLPQDASPRPPATVSVVIPVYNEAGVVDRTLRALVAGATDMSRVQLIVVDAGCSDGTMGAVASTAAELSLAVRTTSSRGGRGAALVAGCAEASGDVILTLHADTRLPDRWDADIVSGLSDPSVLMTAFAFATDRALLASPNTPPAGLSLMEWTVNLRSRWFELPFGDQALAIRSALLEECGGFPPTPILEEYILVNTLRRRCAAGGGRLLTLPTAALCSPRRWEKASVWRTNAVNQVVMLWHRLGASPEQIFEFYYGAKVKRE